MTPDPERSPTSGEGPHGAKRPFDIDMALERIAEAVRPFPKAAMFELAERGYLGCSSSSSPASSRSAPATRQLPLGSRLFAAAATAGRDGARSRPRSMP